MKTKFSALALAALTIGLLCSCKKEEPKLSVTGVTLDQTALTLTVGGLDVKLTATVTPGDATDKAVIWSSSKTDVATVDAEGKVSALAAGKANITATTTDGGKTAICAVQVIEKCPKNVTKYADYLYEYTAEGYSKEAPSELLFDDGPVPIFGCSAVRNGNYYGRNFDFNINEICEFVVRTDKVPGTREYASIGVANTCFLNITNDMVKAGLTDELLKYIPWMTLDGINDAGLVCNVNVVNAADLEKKHDHTNDGATQIMVMQLIRALLDNCGSVAQAKTFIESHDIRPIPTTWDGHIMIADPNETVIVEFTGEKGKEVKYVTQDQMIMTNFYNHLFDENSMKFPAHACGMERYWILKDNFNTGNSMQGMWELLKKVRYTQSYETDENKVNPFWCSEYYDTPKIPDFDKHPMDYWDKAHVLAEEKPAAEVAAYAKYAETGEYDEKDDLWFTTHNSTYDIANKALWVTIREKYENVYKFTL